MKNLFIISALLLSIMTVAQTTSKSKKIESVETDNTIETTFHSTESINNKGVYGNVPETFSFSEKYILWRNVKYKITFKNIDQYGYYNYGTTHPDGTYFKWQKGINNMGFHFLNCKSKGVITSYTGDRATPEDIKKQNENK